MFVGEFWGAAAEFMKEGKKREDERGSDPELLEPSLPFRRKVRRRVR